MTIPEIQSYLETVEKDALLYEEKAFDKRIDTIDFIEFHVIDQIEALPQQTTSPNALTLLRRAEGVKSRLEGVNIALFQRLRTNIRAQDCTGGEFKSLITQYIHLSSATDDAGEAIGYDNLDVLINGLTHLHTIPEQTKDLEPEMVYYQKTPARLVFELVERCGLAKGDVFFDLGAGLGQVAILVNLLSGATTIGIEYEPAFCNYANACAIGLNLSNVSFLNIDARKADYSQGTIFFMFTPFKGEMLQEVLDLLRIESLKRRIKIITYGPCTTYVALQNWLCNTVPANENIYGLSIFTSVPNTIPHHAKNNQKDT